MESFNTGWESQVIKTGMTPIAYYIKRCCKKDIINELKRYGIEIYDIDNEAHKIRVSYRCSTASSGDRDIKKIVIDSVLKITSKLCVIPYTWPNCKWSFDLLSSEVELAIS